MSLVERIEVLARAARLKARELAAEAEVHRNAAVTGAEQARDRRLRAAAIDRAEARASNAARRRLGMAEVPYRPKAEHENESLYEQMDRVRLAKVDRLSAEYGAGPPGTPTGDRPG
jgi:hypothetical protein